MVISSLLLALDVLLSRVLAINTPIMKIGLGFVAVAVCGGLYGPAWTALVAALGDIVGSLIFPTGAYFPGFTLTAAVTGLIFGLCFQNKIDWKRAVIAAVLNVVLVSYIGNSAMIAYVSGTAFEAMLKTRAVQLLVMLPLEAVLLSVALPVLVNTINKNKN